MRLLLATLFLLSGFAGLVYESVWAQYLRMLVGAAAYAQSLVLAVFMGGMALGAWWASRNTHRWANLLRAYAWTELALGLLGLAFHPVFVGAEAVLFGDGLAGAVWPGVATSMRWATAAFLILPQSFLLGMTFPLMAGGFVRRFPQRPGAALAILYFVNALGGAVGVLASGFVFIGRVGLPGTVMAAGIINLAVAALVFWRCDPGVEARPQVAGPPAQSAPEAVRLGTGLLLVAGLAGFASFVYEIVWIRMLSLVLSNSAHAFELMLSAFILGIALGGLWIRGRVDGLAHPVRFLGRVQIAMGALAVATLPLYMALFPWMQHLMETLPRSPAGYLQFNLWSHGMALAVMLPATVCAGMTLPVLTHVLLARGFGERSIGRVYGVNTVGAMLGAILASQVLLPALGLKGALVLGAVMNLSVGLWLGRQEAEGRAGSTEMAWAGAGALAVAIVVLSTGLDRAVLSSGVYRRDIDLASARQARVLRHVDGRTSSVSLVEDRGVLSIRTNGRGESSIALPGRDEPTWDETISTVGAALGLLLHPESRTAVNIGLGAGTTTHTLLASTTLESVTTLELEAAVVDLAREFSDRNHRVFSDPRSRIVVQDARAFLASTRERFDLIVAEPPNLWVSGVGSLYSEEFFELVSRRLTERGLLVHGIPLFEADPPLLSSIVAGVLMHFSEVRAYLGGSGYLIVVATNGPPLPQLSETVFAEPALAAELASVRVRSFQDMAVRTAGDRRTLGAFLNRYPSAPNSELHPRVERRSVRSHFMEEGVDEALRLFVQPIPVMELLGILDRSWTVSSVTPAREFFYSARPVGAVAFRDLLLEGREPDRGADAFVSQAVDLAPELQHDCAFQGFGEDALPAFYKVATSIVTDLGPEELARIWAGLEAWPCLRDLSGDQRLWLDFFRAVGDRGHAAILALVPDLLARPEILTPARTRYLVATAMIVHTARGRGGEALGLWEEHRSRLFEDGVPSELFEQLVELARLAS